MGIWARLFIRGGGAMVLSAVLCAGGAAGQEPRAAATAPQAGQDVGDKGVYIGAKVLTDRQGTSLGTFDLYAAPEDLKDDEGHHLLLTFNDAVKHVAGLRNWHGHDGGYFQNEEALQKAIRDGRYKGEWFVPPRDVVRTQLFANKDKGALQDTFTTSGSGYDLWYWAASEHPDDPSFVYFVVFSDGGGDWVHKDNAELSTRVVRAEPRPPA